MPIYKKCPRCGKRLLVGNKCDCFSGKFSRRTYEDRHKEYDTTSRDKVSRAFYHSTEWLETRADVLALDDYTDLYALATTGTLLAADTVHHIIPLREDYSRRCDRSNLISLSAQSHSTIEQMYKDSAAKTKLQAELFAIVERYRGHRGV